MKVSVAYETNATIANLSTAERGDWSIQEAINVALGEVSQALHDEVEALDTVPGFSAVGKSMDASQCVDLRFIHRLITPAFHASYEGSVIVAAREDRRFLLLVRNPNSEREALLLEGRVV